MSGDSQRSRLAQVGNTYQIVLVIFSYTRSWPTNSDTSVMCIHQHVLLYLCILDSSFMAGWSWYKRRQSAVYHIIFTLQPGISKHFNIKECISLISLVAAILVLIFHAESCQWQATYVGNKRCQILQWCAKQSICWHWLTSALVLRAHKQCVTPISRWFKGEYRPFLIYLYIISFL